jgi:hypothetical protein
MIRLKFSILVAATLLSGCDFVYGPNFINSYGSVLSMTVIYSDGTIATEIWPTCVPTFIGKQGSEITSVSIEKDGKPIRQFTADEIRAMLGKENHAPGLPGWNIGAENVSLNINTTKKPC